MNPGPPSHSMHLDAVSSATREAYRHKEVRIGANASVGGVRVNRVSETTCLEFSHGCLHREGHASFLHPATTKTTPLATEGKKRGYEVIPGRIVDEESGRLNLQCNLANRGEKTARNDSSRQRERTSAYWNSIP